MDTRLVDAAKRGDALAVRSLLFHGGTIHAKDATTGRTPLMIAALNGHEETVLELLHSAEAHLDPYSIMDEQEAQGGYTALHFASGAGKVEIVRLLISVGATVNCTNSYGWTPLHIASWNDRPNTARELLLRGGRLDATDALGRTPLHLASQRGRLKVAYILLDAGADLSTLDHDGHSPLDVAKDQATAAAICKHTTEAAAAAAAAVPMMVPPNNTLGALPAPIIPVTTMIPTTVSIPTVVTPSVTAAAADADASLSSNNSNSNNNNRIDTIAAANWSLVHTLMEQSKETKKAISLLTELVEIQQQQQGQPHSSPLARLIDEAQKKKLMSFSFSSSSSCASPKEVEQIAALQTRLARGQQRDGQQKAQLTQLRHRVLDMEKQERQRVVQIAAMLGKIALYKSQQVEMNRTMAVLFPTSSSSSNNNNAWHATNTTNSTSVRKQQQQQTAKVAVVPATCSSLHRQQSC